MIYILYVIVVNKSIKKAFIKAFFCSINRFYYFENNNFNPFTTINELVK